MSYLNSNSISVFPSAARGQQVEYIEARLTTETVIANIINKLIDTTGFIITNVDEWNTAFSSRGVNDPADPVEFNLYGYYFKVKDPDELFALMPASAEAIYACIALHPVATHEVGTYRYELFGQDDSDLGTYGGVQFNTTDAYENPSILPEFSITKSIKIFDKINNTWELSEDSTFKFLKKSLLFDIDGGEIV